MAGTKGKRRNGSYLMLLVLFRMGPNVCHHNQALNVFFEAVPALPLKSCRRVLDVRRLCCGFSRVEGELELRGVRFGGDYGRGSRESG
jgi:hypothetical protein